jgi:hypothetical protein
MDGANLNGQLQPGDLCTQSGIHLVTHLVHRKPHNVVLRKGDVLPRCKQCGDAVRFRLVKKADEAPHPARVKRARKRSAGYGS